MVVNSSVFVGMCVVDVSDGTCVFGVEVNTVLNSGTVDC